MYAQWVREGKLKVNSDWNKELKIKFTVQDPCQIVRKTFGDPIAEDLRFVVKKELGYIPFLGWYIWAMGRLIRCQVSPRSRLLKAPDRKKDTKRRSGSATAITGSGSLGMASQGAAAIDSTRRCNGAERSWPTLTRARIDDSAIPVMG